MSREDIQRAVNLIKQRLYPQALELLRPLVLDEKVRASAIAVMAYCHQRQENLPLARYLYGEAIQLQPKNSEWAKLLANCEFAHQKKTTEASKGKPGIMGLLLALLLLILGGLAAGATVPGPVADLFFTMTTIEATENGLPFLIGGGVAAGLGLIILLTAFVKRVKYKRRVREAVGEDFSDKKHSACWACNLRYHNSLKACPFCGSPRTQPQPETTVVPETTTVAGTPPLPTPGFQASTQIPSPPLPSADAPPMPSTGGPPPLPPQTAIPSGEASPFGDAPPADIPLQTDLVDDAPFGSTEGSAPFGAASAPQAATATATAVATPRSRKGILIGLAVLALVGGGAAAGYYLLGFQYPAEVRKAQSLYQKGKPVEAFRVLAPYLTKAEDAMVGKAFEALMKGKANRSLLKVAHPEGFFLMGKIGLHHREEVLDAARKDSGGSISGSLTRARRLDYVSNFGEAVKISTTYKRKVAKEIERVLEDRLSTDVNKHIDKVVNRCRPYIAEHKYGEIGAELRRVNEQGQKSEFEAKSLVTLLSQYDKAMAEPWNKKLEEMGDPKKLSAEVAAGSLVAMAPDLTQSLDELTTESIEDPRDIQSLGRAVDPVLYSDRSNPKFVALMNSLYRAYYLCIESAPRRLEGNATNAAVSRQMSGLRADLTRLAVKGPNECLPTLIKYANQDGDLATQVVQATPGFSMKMSSFARSANAPTQGKFNQEAAKVLQEAMVKKFTDTAIAHAEKSPASDFKEYCTGLWPGIQMHNFADELFGRAPQLLEDEATLFAVGWTIAQEGKKKTGPPRYWSGLHEYALTKYLQVYPQGRYVAFARNAPTPGR